MLPYVCQRGQFFPALPGQQIEQRHTVEVAFGQRVQFFPHGQGRAACRPLAALAVTADTGHRRQRLLRAAEDLPGSTGPRLPGELIAALLAPGALHEPRPAQGGDDRLQVFERNALPLGHAFEGHDPLLPVPGQVQHDPQRITPLGGHIQIHAPCLRSFANRVRVRCFLSASNLL